VLEVTCKVPATTVDVLLILPTLGTSRRTPPTFRNTVVTRNRPTVLIPIYLPVGRLDGARLLKTYPYCVLPVRPCPKRVSEHELSCKMSVSTPQRTNGASRLLDRIRSHKELAPERPPHHRSTSFGAAQNHTHRHSLISLPAAEGAGLKSRRLSTNLPEDLVVDAFELDDEFVSASKIGRRKAVGRGASATVKIMVRKRDKKANGRQYAVKEFRKRSSRESEDEYVNKVKSEFTIAKSLHHPNIVQTVQLCTHSGRWNQVMEYCHQGELFGLVERRYMKGEDRQCIFKQVLRGVSYLHEHGIAHRDIKLENLLMTDDGHIKITDFGVSEVYCGEHPGVRSSHGECGKNMKECRQSAPGICGSKPYISPEVLLGYKKYDPSKLDVWSCAILYLTLCLNGQPWQSASREELNYRVFAEGWDVFLEHSPDGPIDETSYPSCGPIFLQLASDGQRRCILRMLHPDPEKRCTIDDALHDRWLKNVECCSPDSDQQASDSSASSAIDVAVEGSCAMMKKMKIQVRHNHTPPEKSIIPQHRFSMGHGYSRYD
jgi:protein-serine/threonine kinase